MTLGDTRPPPKHRGKEGLQPHPGPARTLRGARHSPVRAPGTQPPALAAPCRSAQPAAAPVGHVHPLAPPPPGCHQALDPAPTHVNTKKRVLEPTNSAAAVATGMYLAGLRRVPGLRGILGAAPPHPSPGPGGRGRPGRAGVGRAGWTRRRIRGSGSEGNPTPRAAAAR